MSNQQKKRDDVATKLSIVNKIIRKGFDSTYNTIIYKDYCNSIKNCNYFRIKEDLMYQLCPLVINY